MGDAADGGLGIADEPGDGGVELRRFEQVERDEFATERREVAEQRQ